MERDHLQDAGVDGKTILKCIFKKRDGEYELDRSGTEQREAAGKCECGTELSGFVKRGEFPDWFRNY